MLSTSCEGEPSPAGGTAEEVGGQDSGTATSPTAAESPAVEPTMVGRLRITPTRCSLRELDGPVGTGEIAFTAVNETDGLAAFNVARLDEGSSFEAFSSHIRKEIRLATAGRPGLGHPSFAVPLFEVLLEAGERGRLVGTVGEPGTFVIACARVYEEVGELRPADALGPLEVR
jgi:hypothetical protein